MANFCVCCGDIIPEGTMVCFACDHDPLGCPDCGAALKHISSCRSYTGKQALYHRLYHCEKCHSDWEATNSTEKITTELHRKFWG